MPVSRPPNSSEVLLVCAFFGVFSFCSYDLRTLVMSACFSSCWWFPYNNWFPFCFFGTQHIQRHNSLLQNLTSTKVRQYTNVLLKLSLLEVTRIMNLTVKRSKNTNYNNNNWLHLYTGFLGTQGALHMEGWISSTTTNVRHPSPGRCDGSRIAPEFL